MNNLVPRLRSSLNLACFVWLLFAALSVSLYRMNGNSAWWSDQISPSLKQALAGQELVYGFIAVLAGTFAAQILCAALRRLRFFPFFAAVFVAVPAFCFVLAYLSEWYSLLSTGQFAGIDGLIMWLTNPKQISQHVAQMEPRVVLAIPAAAALAGALLFGVLPALSRRVHWVSTAALVITSAALFAAALSTSRRLSSEKDLQQDEALQAQADINYSAKELLELLAQHKTGPILRFVSDIRERRRPAPMTVSLDGYEADYRPQISLEQYVASVDRTAFHPWNVIVIIVESLRPDQLRAFGGAREVMPAVEEVSRNGRRFLRNYTQASHSNYADICPFSSQYPLRSARYAPYPEHPLYPRVLIYDLLKALGYRTAIISSQNERWGDMFNYLNTAGLDYFLHAENFEGSTYVPRNDFGFEKFLKGSKRAGKIDDRLTVGEIVKWIRKDRGKPFFVYTNLQNSHVPYEIPSDFPKKFSPPELDFTIRFGSFPKEKTSVVKDVYADSLAYIDAQISRLISALREDGLLDDTLLVITGDTGQAFFEHGFAGHANELYDELMRVPLIFSGAGVVEGSDSRLSQHIDVSPSILSLLGLPPHPSFQGKNLFGADERKEEAVFLVSQTPLAHEYGIVKDRFKLLFDFRANKVKLFDLQEDPGESKNIFAKEPGTSRSLFAELMAWRKYQLEYYQTPHLMRQFYPPAVHAFAPAEQ